MQAQQHTQPMESALTVAEVYDQAAATYDDAHADPASQWERERIKHLLQKHAPKPLDQCTVYDLGCGTGLYFDLGLTARKYKGFDISQGMIDRAISKYPKQDFYVDDIRKLRYFACLDADYVIGLYGSMSELVSLNPAWILRAFQPHTRFFFMLCASGHGDGIDYRIDPRQPDIGAMARHYSTDGAFREFYDCQRVEIFGFSQGLPVGKPLNKWRRWCCRVNEILRPDECDYLIVTGLTSA